MASSGPVCNTLGVNNYSNPLHIAGLFVILCGGFLGAFLPVAAKRYPWLRIPGMVLQLGRAFGTGVVIATGFVHMMPPALANLSDACLPGFFTDTYNSLGAAIALGAALFMQLLEFSGRVYIGRYMDRIIAEHAAARKALAFSAKQAHAQVPSEEGTLAALAPDPEAGTLQGASALQPDNAESIQPSPGSELCACAVEEPVVKTQLTHSEGSALCSLALSDEDRSDEKKLLDKAELRNLKLIVIIFEFGVAVHSVIVGLDFGVSTGQTAVTLFAALIFHQFFEGVALGTTISEADFAWWLVMLMVISFALETPVGTAIGMGISRAYNPNSVASLVIRGVLDGLSAGILIYTGLVDLLTYRFTLNTELHKQQLVWVVLTIAFVWAGAIGMSIIGAWI